jgi:multiple sugar transport system permease protein
MSTLTGQIPHSSAPPVLRDRTSIFHRSWKHRSDYLYVLPALMVMLIVIAYPIYYTVELSFYRTPASLQLRDATFIGLENYATLLRSPGFWKVTWQTLVWTVFSTFFAFVLGLRPRLR